MFYQKAAVMDTLVLKPCPLRLYAPLRIHPSGSVLPLVKHLELPEPVNLYFLNKLVQKSPANKCQ